VTMGEKEWVLEVFKAKATRSGAYVVWGMMELESRRQEGGWWRPPPRWRVRAA
jgi:hypothetical protein